MGILIKRFVLAVYALTPKTLRMLVVRHTTPNFTAGVVCLLVRANGEVLFAQSTYRKGWSLPGGLMDRNEQPRVAAMREVREELGISVDIGEPYRVSVVTSLQTVTFFTSVVISDEQVTLIKPDPIEIKSLQWFAAEHMPELDEELAPLCDADSEHVRLLLRG